MQHNLSTTKVEPQSFPKFISSSVQPLGLSGLRMAQKATACIVAITFMLVASWLSVARAGQRVARSAATK